jgi:hypothetical protein
LKIPTGFTCAEKPVSSHVLFKPNNVKKIYVSKKKICTLFQEELDENTNSVDKGKKAMPNIVNVKLYFLLINQF